MFKSVLFAIATAALVSADNIVSITSPLANNVYTAGGQAIITWINPTVDVISQIELSKGLSTALQPVMTIATNVTASDMKYTWDVPATLPAGADYAFVFGTSPNLSYTGQFTIKAADGTANASSSAAVSSSVPSSSAAVSSSAASSSAAASGSPKPASSPASSSSASSSGAAASSKPSNAGGKVAPVAVSAMAVVGAAAIALM